MAKRKVKDVVWTKYLTERTLLRAWYVLENNYYKGTIKRVMELQGEDCDKVSYATCHNSLYKGLYYPNEELIIGEKPLPRIKAEKGILTKSSVIANTMPPYEILQNIHAMHNAALNIADIYEFNDYGNNLNGFYELSHQAGVEQAKLYIDKTLVNEDSNALKPLQEPCYKYVKKIKADLKLGKPVGTVYTEGPKFKKAKFDRAMKDYRKAYNQFRLQLSYNGILEEAKVRDLIINLDNGLYNTMIGNIGFDFNALTLKQNPEDYLSRKDLILHTEKLEIATREIKSAGKLTYQGLASNLLYCAESLREKYIHKNKVYPECNKGFYNAFAEMLALNFEYNGIKNTSLKNYPEEIEEIMNKMKELKKSLLADSSKEEKQEIFNKIDKISEILGK